MVAAPGVTTIGEFELLDMLQDPQALIIDSRTPDWFAGGTIPGAINIPYTRMSGEPAQLGCAPDFNGWLCEDARDVALSCNGAWSGHRPPRSAT